MVGGVGLQDQGTSSFHAMPKHVPYRNKKKKGFTIIIYTIAAESSLGMIGEAVGNTLLRSGSITFLFSSMTTTHLASATIRDRTSEKQMEL